MNTKQRLALTALALALCGQQASAQVRTQTEVGSGTGAMGRIGSVGTGIAINPMTGLQADIKNGALQRLSALTPVPTVVPGGAIALAAPEEAAAGAPQTVAALRSQGLMAAEEIAAIPNFENQAAAPGATIEMTAAARPDSSVGAQVGAAVRKVAGQVAAAFASSRQRLADAAAIPQDATWDYRGLIHTPRYIEDQYLGKMLDPRVGPGEAKKYRDEAYRQYYAELDALRAKYPGIDYHATMTGRARMALAVRSQAKQAKVAEALAIPGPVVKEYSDAKQDVRTTYDYVHMLIEEHIRTDNIVDSQLMEAERQSARAAALEKQYPQLPYRVSLAGRVRAALAERAQKRQARIQAAAAIPDSVLYTYRALKSTPRYIEDQYLGKVLDPKVGITEAKKYRDEAYRQYYAELDGLKAAYPELAFRDSLVGRIEVALLAR